MLKLVFLVAAAFAVNAQAGTLTIDGRADWVGFQSNQDAGIPAYSAFQMSRLRLGGQNKLGESNSFTFRTDLLSANLTATTRDKTSKFIDYAFFNHKFSEEFTLTMGKYLSGMGGVEGSVNPGDIYQKSLAGTEVAAIYWPVGAQAGLTFGDHYLRVNASNNSEDVLNATGGTLNQTSQMFGATFTTKLMDGMIMPNVSYHTETFYSTGAAQKKVNNYMALGARFVHNEFEVEADYLNNNYKPETQASGNVLDTTSIVGLVRYHLADLGSVHVKYEGSSRKTATSSTADSKADYTGLTAAFEYKPSKDDNWRMHAAYTQMDMKPTSGNTQTSKTVYVGMRLVADILK